MALSRGRRYEPVNYWPGFVDALSTMLLVIIFLLSVFMLAQFFLSREVTGKDEALVEAQSADRGTDQPAGARAHPERRRRKQDIGPHRNARLGAAGAEAAQGRRVAGRGRRRRRQRPGLGGGHRARSAEADIGAGAGPGRRAQPADRRAAQAARGDRGRARRIGDRRTRNRSRRSPTSASGSTSRWRRRFRSSIATARTFSAACGRSSARGPMSGWSAIGSCSNPRCCSMSARPTSARPATSRSTRSPPP